jgi:4-diphosphocytidyl-2-C-methyl-D-erythritol kinase
MTPCSGHGTGSSERRIVVDAPAKVNLGLEVIGPRDDGFHEIATILMAIDLYDHLTLSPADELEVTCDDESLSDQENLALRALHLLREETNHPGGAHIHLHKKIPSAAGLGGASSDAAAALRGGLQLWEQNVSGTKLHNLAARLGSDVPFFLHGGCAVARGRGDNLKALPLPLNIWFIIVVLDVRILAKTTTLYARLSSQDFSDGTQIAAQAARLSSGLFPDTTLLENAFTRPLYAIAPELAALPKIMRDAGAASVAISGAGPAHYALFTDATEAERVGARLRERLGGRGQVFVTRPAPARPRSRPRT